MFLGTRAAKRQNKRDTSVDWRPLLPVLVVVAGFVAYYNSFFGAFVFDDQKGIVQEPRIRQLWPISDVVSGVRRPVADLSLAINYALGGLDVWGYHAFNLGVHILAGLTLFGVVRRTLSCERLRDRYGSGAPWFALAAAVLWVVHPLQTQSVTYVIQRSESLMGLFYLLTLYCVIRGADSPHGKGWYTGAIAACALGMGSKAVMVTAPVVVLIYDRVFIARSFGEVLRRRWGLYVGLGATWTILVMVGVVTGVLDPTSSPTGKVGFAFKGITPLEYALTQPGVILHYLRLSVWPDPLCLDYGWPVAQSVAAIAVPGIVILGLCAVAVWGLLRKPSLGFLGAWFFIILAPTSSFIPIKDPLFEHRMYLPLAAIIVLAVVGGYEVLSRLGRHSGWLGPLRRRFSAGLIALLAVALCLGTIRRNWDYRSDVAMWRDVLAKRPTNPRAHAGLGNVLCTAGEFDEAIDVLRAGIHINPNNVKAHNNLIFALGKAGRIDEAKAATDRAVKIDPTNANAWNVLGAALGELGRIDEAIEAFDAALRIRPDFVGAHFGMGKALADRRRFDGAIEHYREALKHRPRYVGARLNLGAALLAANRTEEAIEAFREVVRIDPRHGDAYANLGSVLLKQDKPDEAIEAFRRALQIDPTSASAQNGMGIALIQQGKVDAAIAAFRRAVQVKPDFAFAFFNLGRALSMQGRTDEAIEAYRQTLKVAPNHAGARQELEAALAARRRSD